MCRMCVGSLEGEPDSVGRAVHVSEKSADGSFRGEDRCGGRRCAGRQGAGRCESEEEDEEEKEKQE